jgi:hypothetical protein
VDAAQGEEEIGQAKVAKSVGDPKAFKNGKKCRKYVRIL